MILSRKEIKNVGELREALDKCMNDIPISVHASRYKYVEIYNHPEHGLYVSIQGSDFELPSIHFDPVRIW